MDGHERRVTTGRRPALPVCRAGVGRVSRGRLVRLGVAIALLSTSMVVTFGALIPPAPAAAAYDGTVYAIADSLNAAGGTIHTVSAAGVASASLGTTAFDTVSLARQPGTNLLYYTEYQSSSTFRVATFDVVTRVNVTLGTIATYMPRLAFRSDGTLWGMEDGQILRQLNTTTGAFIGSAITLTTAGGGAAITASGDIAFTPSGSMYIVTGSKNLYRADPVAGTYATATLIGAMTGVAGGSTYGATIGSGGVLFVSDSSSPTRLYSLNVTTATATIVGTNMGVVVYDLATAPDRPPVAIADSATTPVATAVTVSVKDNDTDADTDTLTVTATTNGANGTVTIVGGNPRYTPNAGFHGTDTFTYTISDGNGGTATATVTVSVNSPPVAVNDTASTPGNTPVTITNVRANDTDPNGDTLTVTSVGTASSGAVALVSGNPVYTPTASFKGAATFTYTISDGFGGTATATVTVTVANQPPVANNNTATTTVGSAVAISTALANDTDANGDTLSITGATNGTNGTVTRVGNVLTYTPVAGFSGTDTFTYSISDGDGGTSTATITVTVNPTSANDTGTTTANTTLNGTGLLANDAGTGLTVTGNTAPTRGTVTVASNGSYTYTPTIGTSGPDSFTYTATDSSGRTTTATVNITVRPLTLNDTGTTGAGIGLNGATVLGNDAGTTLTVIANTNPANGTVTILGNGTYTYTPNAGFSGSDSFTYTVRDASNQTSIATVNLVVAPRAIADSATTQAGSAFSGTSVLVNDLGSGLAVTANTNPANGTVTILANGTYTYTPNTGRSGPDSFTYTATDSSGRTTSAVVSLTVTPRAFADAASTSAGQAVTIDARANDLGAGLTITSLGTPSSGNSVFAAHTPGRCAAPPAPAMMTSKPREAAAPI